MKMMLLAAAIALVGTKAPAAETLTSDEIARLPFMTAFAYAEAVDTFCLPEWHYASTALATAAITQADLQDKSYFEAEQTAEASLLQNDRSACQPAKAFVNEVSATIPEMQPKMNATLAVMEKEEARRDAVMTRRARLAQCGHVVATVKAFLEAKWSLTDDYQQELSRCIVDLAAIPEAALLLADAKTLLPQMNERMKMQSAKDGVMAEQSDADRKQIIADWCAKQTQKNRLVRGGEEISRGYFFQAFTDLAESPPAVPFRHAL